MRCRFKATAKKLVHRDRLPVPSANGAASQPSVPTVAHDLPHSLDSTLVLRISQVLDEQFQQATTPHTEYGPPQTPVAEPILPTHGLPLIPIPRQEDDEQAHQIALQRLDDEANQPLVSQENIQGKASNGSLGIGTAHLGVNNDLWAQAFARLSKEQCASLSTLTNNNDPAPQPAAATSIIPDLIATTRQRQEECEQKFWRVKLGKGPENVIILRDQAAQIISWITFAGDIGVQFAPSLLTQIWPGVKALLKLPVKEAEQMAAVLKVADKVARVVARGTLLEACYNATNTPQDALEILHAALVEVYTACLALLATASGLLNSSLLARTSYSILHPDAVKDGAGTSLSDLEAQLARDVLLVAGVSSAAMTSDLCTRLQKLDTPITRIDERVEQVLESLDAEEAQRILDWISPVQYSSHHDLVAEARMPGTCDWILKHPKFLEWESSSGCALMWLRGLTGTGKTFLTSKVVDYQRGLLDSGLNDEAVAFFYFSRTDSSRASALACLQSLVRQFSTCRQRQDHIQPALRKLHIECRRDGRTLSRELCKNQLIQSVNLFPRSTVIIDAVDECREDDITELVRSLESLMEASYRPLKIFISGRPNGEIRDAFRDHASVEIGVEDNQEDIANFIKDKIRNHRRWDKFQGELKERVETTLINESQAMFRWAALQIHELFKLRSREDVDTRLGKLPVDLKTAYDEIYLTQIMSAGETSSAVAQRAIMWVLVALKPLTSEHLLPAIRIDPSRYKKHKTDLGSGSTKSRLNGVECVTKEVDEELLVELCANFLTLDTRTKQWTFAHASVSEYFEEHHFSTMHANTCVGFASLLFNIHLAQSVHAGIPLGALQCLWSGTSEDDARQAVLTESLSDRNWEFDEDVGLPTAPVLRQDAFVTYALTFWGEHVAVVDKAVTITRDVVWARTFDNEATILTNDLRILLKGFLGHPDDSSSEYRFWRREFCRYLLSTWRFDEATLNHIYHVSTEKHASFAMVHHGFINLLSNWWPTPSNSLADSNDVTREPRPLPNMDTTVRSVRHSSLLYYACTFGHAPIVSALLAMGADAEEITDALVSAGTQGFVEVCQVLTQFCLPNTPPNIDNVLYEVATDFNHLNIIRHLISVGADPYHQQFPDFKGKSLETLFSYAAKCNEVKTLRMLVEESHISPKCRLPSQSELIHAAIAAARNLGLDALRYLVLHAHADPNGREPGAEAETILLAAAAKLDDWDGKVVDCLKECGVDFNVQKADLDRLWETYQASSRQGGVYGSCLLEVALAREQEQVIRIGVEHWGQEVNALSYSYSRCGSALVAAAQSGDLGILQYLLQKGADVNCQVPRGDYHNPLVAAVFPIFNSRRKEWKLRVSRARSTMDVLLQHGADVNLHIKHGHFGSVLAAAATSTHTNALELLIDAGAQVDLTLENGLYGSALIAAAACGHMANVWCLLHHGADINLVTTVGDYKNAFMAAVKTGRSEMISSMIKAGAEVNRPENCGWETELQAQKRQIAKEGRTPKRFQEPRHQDV